MARQTSHPSDVTVSQNFRLVFFSVLGLTIASMVISVLLVVAAPPSEQASGVLHIEETIWQVGAGAIIGLLGGKALQ